MLCARQTRSASTNWRGWGCG